MNINEEQIIAEAIDNYLMNEVWYKPWTWFKKDKQQTEPQQQEEPQEVQQQENEEPQQQTRRQTQQSSQRKNYGNVPSSRQIKRPSIKDYLNPNEAYPLSNALLRLDREGFIRNRTRARNLIIDLQKIYY